MDIKVSITILDGEDRGKTFQLENAQTIIGRSRGDIMLSDRKISGEHLSITIEGKKVFAEDLASTNGSFHNDEQFENQIEIKNLDEVTVGFTRFRVSIVEDLAEFRKANKPARKTSKEKGPKKKVASAPAAKKAKRKKKLDIGNMIDEELKRFSRWDIVQSDGLSDIGGRSLELPKVTLQLEVIDGPEKGRTIRLTKGNTVLGRAKADVKFRDNDISRNHASIETFSEKQIFLRDLASTNGTFLNEKRVSYSKLNNEDIIQVGSTVMRFTIHQE
jgi:pSer/pThr/pTyr-binding forkhead associated (FHA) protein